MTNKLSTCPLRDTFEHTEDFANVVAMKTNAATLLYKNRINDIYQNLKSRLKAQLQKELENLNSGLTKKSKVLIDAHSSDYSKLRQAYAKSTKKIRILEQSSQSDNSDCCSSFKKLKEINKELSLAIDDSYKLERKIEGVFGFEPIVEIDTDTILSSIRFKVYDETSANLSSNLTSQIEEVKKSNILNMIDSMNKFRDSISPVKNPDPRSDRRIHNSFISQMTAKQSMSVKKSMINLPHELNETAVIRCSDERTSIQVPHSNQHKQNETGVDINLSAATFREKTGLDHKIGQSSRRLTRNGFSGFHMTNFTPKITEYENEITVEKNKFTRGNSLNHLTNSNESYYSPKLPRTTEIGSTVSVESQVITEEMMKRLLGVYFCGKKDFKKIVFRKNVFECDPILIMSTFFDSPLKDFVSFDMLNNRFAVELKTQLRDKKKLLYNKVKIQL